MISCRTCKHLYWTYCMGDIIVCKRKPPKTKDTLEGLRKGEVYPLTKLDSWCLRYKKKEQV
jgi:hypothetical protein